MNFSLVALFITLLQVTNAVVCRAVCSKPTVRLEWRQLSDAQKLDFHQAVLCLMSKPQQRYPNERPVVSRADDLTWTHVELGEVIHNVANFLPWHRMLVNEHERLIRTECAYTGPYPYWDWTIDADANTVPTSPIFDPATGFGGNGVRIKENLRKPGFEKCVNDGPYTGRNFTVGSPTYFDRTDMPHCLVREFNDDTRNPTTGEWNVGDMHRQSYDSARMARVNSNTDYSSFHNALENGPHGAIHNLVGGDMRPRCAPNDPLFYMHHANIDRIWAKWQSQDPSRVYDYSGFNDLRQTIPASINDTMPTLTMLEKEVTVWDYMNTKDGELCYEYDTATGPSDPPVSSTSPTEPTSMSSIEPTSTSATDAETSSTSATASSTDSAPTTSEPVSSTPVSDPESTPTSTSASTDSSPTTRPSLLNLLHL